MALMKVLLAWGCCVASLLSAQVNDISGERMRAHVKFLASDSLEGRGVGTRGGDLAVEYIAAQFALSGLKPAGDNGTYFQKFTLVGALPQESTQLTASGSGQTLTFQWLDEFVGVTFQQKPDAEVDADGRERTRALGAQLGLAPEEASEFPLALLGTPEELCDALGRRRERWGFSYTIVPSDRMEAFAPVVARLAGK